MTKLSTTSLGTAWLESFEDTSERATAALLIDELLLVSRDELICGLRQAIEAILTKREDPQRPIALFAERAVPKFDKVVQPFFPSSASGRATGSGVPPIIVDPRDQEVGSEGLVANLITDLARYYGKSVLSHPGPDLMRAERVRHIVIVADFIGSGKRVWEMLEAFRAVATLRSWRSYKLLQFNVVAYSGTEVGLEAVHSSRLKPLVSIVIGCPTLFNTFTGTQLSRVLTICHQYPRGHRHPVGFMNGGALIAFAHGMPNNAPPILHSRTKGWTPLFRGRSTAGTGLDFPSDARETAAERANRLLRISNAYAYLSNAAGNRWITTMMVLAAIDAGARTPTTASARSGLSLSRVEEILGYTRIARWTTGRNALTTLGRQELGRLRRRRRRTPVLPKPGTPFYYPTQLRAR